VVQGETPADDGGWAIALDAPRARLQALFGLGDGDGGFLRTALAPEFAPVRDAG
jgi:hypothetical protein